MKTLRLCVAIVVGLVLGSVVVPPCVGQWIEPPGTGWMKLGFSHHDTQTRFNASGQRESYLEPDARSVTRTARLTAAIGLGQGVDTWVKVPFHHLQFNDAIRERSSRGFGDPRLFLRVGPKLVGFEEIPVSVALRGGVKWPTGTVGKNIEVIPLSEGQRDWEAFLEVGRNLHPWPIYVMGWVGYRWREVDEDTGFNPGDERIVYGAIGGSIASFTWKVAVDGSFGEPPSLPQNRRELLQVIPVVGWKVGPGRFEGGGRWPVHGRNLPAGPTFTLSYFLSWDDPLWK